MILLLKLNYQNVNASDKVKDTIRKEFRGIKEMMDFDKKSHEIFRNWYVDGRLYYMKVIDTKKPEDGIQEIRYIDPMKMKFVRQEKKKNKNLGGVDLSNAFKGTEKTYIQKLKNITFIHQNQLSSWFNGGTANQKLNQMLKIQSHM